VLTAIEDAAEDTVIEAKLPAAALTLSVAVDCSVPDCAVIVTVPGAEPVAAPPAAMLAMFESEEFHCTELVTSFVLPSERWAVAVNCCWAPIPIEIKVGETCIEETVGGEEVLDCEPPPELQPAIIANTKRSKV
jgi:hypothetical protein